jgi:hypothetical protein
VNRRELSELEYNRWIASRCPSSASSSSLVLPVDYSSPLAAEPFSVDQAATILLNMSVSPRSGPLFSSPSPMSSVDGHTPPSLSAPFDTSMIFDAHVVEGHGSISRTSRVTRSKPQGLVVEFLPYSDPSFPSPPLDSSTSGHSPTSEWSLETPSSVSLVLPSLMNYDAEASKLVGGSDLAYLAVKPSLFSSR